MATLQHLLVVFALAFSIAAQSAPEVKELTASPGEPPEEDELSMCSLGCAMGWHIKASSALPRQEGRSYDVGNIDDYRVSTAWLEGSTGYGIGESITYTFTKEDFKEAGVGNSINFNGFLILNGYCKDTKTWTENSRVKRIRVDYNGVPLYEVLLNDSMNLQEVRWPSVYLKPGDIVKVTILEAFPGTKFQDSAISELIPTGAH